MLVDRRDCFGSDVTCMREERKVVTVLFADLVGSTSIGERFDPEDAREIVQGAITRTIEAIEGFGGTIKDVAGDGVLALFGAPAAHEDDPERAVLAGLCVVDRIAGYAREMAGTWGVEGFAVRVGIETGLAVLGPVGAGGKVEYGAVGDVLNTAARLQSRAEPGTVLVGETTRRAVEGLFTWGERRDLVLKGKAESSVASVALEERRRRWVGRGLPGARTPFVGRSEELAVAEDVIGELLDNRGGMLILTGEPGVGKSRLMSECRDLFLAARGHGTVGWLEGRCLSYAEDLPYGVYRDLLLGWLDLAPDASPEATRQALREAAVSAQGTDEDDPLPFLVHVLGLPPEDETTRGLAGLDAEEVQRRTFDAAASLMADLAARAPVVVAIEDLHWADPTSLALTEHLLPFTVTAPLLLLLTMRPYPDHPSAELVARAADRLGERARVLELTPLPGEADRELLHALVGAGTLPKDLERTLLDVTGGNPFFLEEQVRALAEAGALVPNGGRWRFDHRVPVEVAQSVEKVVLARLDRLTPTSRATLVAASVLGREFTLGLLEAVGGEGRGTLQELERLDLLRVRHRGAEPEYRFKHALIQEAAYRSLLKRRRRELHARAAEALVERFDDRTDEIAATLGHHLAEAGEIERAIPYLVTAADRAKDAYANDEAIALYRRAAGSIQALATGRTGGNRGWRQTLCDVCERSGEVLELLSRHDEAAEAYERALEATATSDRLQTARLRALLSEARAGAHRYPEALAECDLAERALGSVPVDPSPQWLSSWLQIQDARMLSLYWLGDTDAYAELIDRVRPVVQEHGSAEARGAFFDGLATMSMQRDRYVVTDETVAYARVAYDAVQGGDLGAVSWTRFSLGFTLLWHGDLDGSIALLEETLHEADLMGDATLRSRCLTYLMVARRKLGDVEGTRERLDTVIEAATTASLPEYEAMSLANRAWVAWRLGDAADAMSSARAALDIWQGLQIRYPFDWMALWPLVGIAVADGRVAEAMEHIRKMLPSPQQPLPEPLRAAVERTLEAWDSGRSDEAEQRLGRAMAIARRLAYL
jgi:class 3 adenylate cyclase/tetratricopeptide (TPR) repeat protein